VVAEVAAMRASDGLRKATAREDFHLIKDISENFLLAKSHLALRV
jgi:hypothetical protein